MSPKGKLLLLVFAASVLSLMGLFFAVRGWMPFMWFLVFPAIAGLFGWLAVDRAQIRGFVGMKATKHGLNMGLLIAITLSLLAAINFFSARHHTAFDFSSSSINTVSDQSKQLLAALDEELNVKFFYKTGADRAEENKKIFRELVKHYQDASSKIALEIVEINESPKLAEEFGANRGTGEAFVQYKGNKNRIESYTEQDFTNAIIKLTRKEKKQIYFLQGHNERSIDDEKSEISLFGFRQMLEKNSFEVKKLTLSTGLAVPTDAHVLIIAGPTQQFQAAELKALENFLEAGGNLLLLLDERETLGLSDLLKKFGIEYENHFVYSVLNTTVGKVVNPQAATIAEDYSASNEITRVFTANQMTVFRNPHSLKSVAKSEKINLEFIVKTPKSSVALDRLDSKDYSGEPRSFNFAAMVKGSLNSSTKEFTAVVYSDADFVSTIFLSQNLNRDLALNTISSLAKETDLISISPREPLASKMLVSPPEFGQFFKFTVVGLFFPLPFVFMILSLVLWHKRRHA